MNPTAAVLLKKIEKHSATVGVIGLGYVGLPLAIEFAKAGFPVLGFDTDAAKVRMVNAGKSYIKHIPAERVRELSGRKSCRATTNAHDLTKADCILICVPTPLTRQREPDMTYIVSTTSTIAGRLRKGQLVVLESSTYPGTTREVVMPPLEKKGLKAGKDFFLAFSPEREDPGNPKYSTHSIPKVVGGLTPDCLKLAATLYSTIVPKVTEVSSPEAAEATKLLENIFRCVNIALVNELKIVFDRMGIDVWEVIEAAKSKPFGYMPFYPGPGLGGHCIPIDPFYLTWKAREFEIPTRFIELAGDINTAMPEYVLERLSRALNEEGRSLKGSRVLLIGAAYKKDVDDMRESPSLRLIELLRERGASVEYHDPFIPVLPPTRKYQYKMKSVALSPKSLKETDVVLISTDHSSVDYGLIGEYARLVVDTRNAMARAGKAKARVVRA
ncbi:MAG: nucleotide sugar dehydrogenase [Candidatus Aureabacteria bacterium]|nr:nucleotide sugar dehydrogenase [Candidatus Auribacterota bacterium]